jgi:hypothetical protein
VTHVRAVWDGWFDDEGFLPAPCGRRRRLGVSPNDRHEWTPRDKLSNSSETLSPGPVTSGVSQVRFLLRRGRIQQDLSVAAG